MAEPNWKQFEIDATDYLIDNFSKYAQFTHMGESDSTQSDILVEPYNNQDSFYIEAKMGNAQCGQFVILRDDEEECFYYSPNNANSENQYSDMIIDYINDNYDDFADAGSKGVPIDLEPWIFAEWIKDMYTNHKNAEFVITDDRGDFKIVPMEDFDKTFDISATLRCKKWFGTYWFF